MAYEPGGYADKLGNRYEGRWVVKQLLRVLLEHIVSVTVEAIGDDQDGVDLVLVQKGGERQFQQCKARNRSKEFWTVPDLNNRGILKTMRSHLERYPACEFAFVTGVPSTVFGDICQSARKSNSNPEDFYEHQIRKIGEGRRKTFQQFCQYLGLDPDKPLDRSVAFDYLRRTYIIQWLDDQNTTAELLGWAAMLVTGHPQTIVALLSDFAQDNIRKILDVSTVWAYLTAKGFHPRQLAADSRIAPAVQDLQRRFEDSISPGLIAAQLIPRSETQELLKMLNDNSIVILHGRAGCGKSGVLYELTRILRNQARPFLPVRLDRQIPQNTTEQFGQDVDLPESPVLCLDSLSAESSGVLILDQLDALRWTSSHSANALDVCKAIIREVHNLQTMGKHISAVLSCRTFDLENDPEIKRWLSNNKSLGMHYQKIEVKTLPEESVRSVVENVGGDFSRLNTRQREILALPHHLAMWVTLANTNCSPEFQSAAQLMRAFWEDRYRTLEMRGVTSEQAHTVLNELVHNMENKGRLFAPESLVRNHQRSLTELQTCGILRIDNQRVSFCHQSYLDFLIASRELNKIHREQSNICTWLGPKERQSLFRREQIRQLLSLLSDESPDDFLKSVQELLSDTGIRFHLKHLALGILGQIEQPTETMLDYATELLQDSGWRDHALELVYFRHVPYIHSLVNRGIITSWLESSAEPDIESALWLLRSVNEISGDLISDLLGFYLEKASDWLTRFLNVLPFHPEKDSDKLFEFRVQIARKGYVRDFFQWAPLAKKYPLRAIALMEAAISTWDTPADDENTTLRKPRRSMFDHWTQEDSQAFKEAVRNNPFFTWDVLMPHVERLTAIELDEYDSTLDDWRERCLHSLHLGDMSLPRCIVLLLREAGATMAKGQPTQFLDRARRFQNNVSPVIQEILITSYTALPPKFADDAIGWILSDSKRLATGLGYKEPKWMPAERLIEALSPYCSDELFRKLENAITHYHLPNERELAEYYLPAWKKGYFGDYWGRAQYFLLPALEPTRRAKETKGLIAVLKRKFANYPMQRFLSGGYSTGGCVGSPISGRGHAISDRAWLAIIKNKEIPEDDGSWKQTGPDAVAESSVRHFSNALRNAGYRYPERFGHLALKFPKDVHPLYIAAILDAVKITEPKNVPDDEKSTWEPARIETVEAILDKFALGDDRSVANDFCWLIRDRAHEHWSQKAINQLIHYATCHPDPEPEKLNVYTSGQGNEAAKASVDDLSTNVLNSVRGVAAMAIGALLWKHPDWLERLVPAIAHLVDDPHPAVRMAALEACLPVLNTDRDLAVKWFVCACQDDARVAADRRAVYYFNCCIKTHFGQLSPIILRMLNSPREEVAEGGAAEVCARWIFFDMFQEQLEKCKTGNIAQRKGLARVASHFLLNEKYTERCRQILQPFFDDLEPKVRQKARHVFHNNDKILKMANMIDFTRDYVRTPAFRDDPTGLIFIFENFTDSLIPYSKIILDICTQFCGPLAESSRDLATGAAHDAGMLSPLILRLYEQSQDAHPDIRNRCLDAWDMMFEHRIGLTRELMQQIDSY